MTQHLENLEMAFGYYKKSGIHIDFDHGNMFSFVYSADKKTWDSGEEPLPFTTYDYGNLVITEEELLGELSRVPQKGFSLEADIRPLGASVSDKKYHRPANPAMSILTEANSGMIISCDMNEPDETQEKIKEFRKKAESGEIYFEFEVHYYEFDDDGRYMDDWKNWHNVGRFVIVVRNLS